MEELARPQFETFRKIPRLRRRVVVTEKIDGTNAQIVFPDDGGPMCVGSRNRWITPDDDNQGFARWAYENEGVLRRGLGFGRHYGEWWGAGIQRTYGLKEKRFWLFNTSRWNAETLPKDIPQIGVVPVLYDGLLSTDAIDGCIQRLRDNGSVVVPGFTRPEGIVIYHVAGDLYFKQTIEKDEEPKGKVER